MVHVAAEMERRGIKLPLLIGGATTSRQHTAVKIAPSFGGTTVHVLDASRAVGVVAALLDEKQRPAFDAANREDQERMRVLHKGKKERALVTLDTARANKPRFDWRSVDVPTPSFTGGRVIENADLNEIAKYIDWQFFFTAWELRGKFPAILQHPEHGEAARDLYDHGLKMLRQMIDGKQIKASATYGFWPAASDGDDIVLYADASRTRELTRFNMLRQQLVKENDKPHLCLADYVAPVGTGRNDHVGAFAVTAGIGVDELARSFQAQHDDYNSIIVKALADRLAEAFAEMLHAKARKEWGYGASEALSNEQLIEESYRGIRPAFGYPACPDHTEKQKLFSLLDAPRVGITLTESFAMMPAASVSGIYLAHPEARYFNLGMVDRDQVQDYARRKSMTLAEAERWLSPSLGYEPKR